MKLRTGVAEKTYNGYQDENAHYAQDNEKPPLPRAETLTNRQEELYPHLAQLPHQGRYTKMCNANLIRAFRKNV